MTSAPRPEPLDGAGGEVLHHHVGLGGEVLDELQASRVFQVDGDGLLVGVEIQEIRDHPPRLAAERPAWVAAAWDFRPSPPRRPARRGSRCRTARPRTGSYPGPARLPGSRRQTRLSSSAFFPVGDRVGGTLGRKNREGKPLGPGGGRDWCDVARGFPEVRKVFGLVVPVWPKHGEAAAICRLRRGTCGRGTAGRPLCRASAVSTSLHLLF